MQRTLRSQKICHIKPMETLAVSNTEKKKAGGLTNERPSVTCITCLEWNLTLCSCWTIWGSHSGVKGQSYGK